jgi:2-keto-4-pentenoate hydratase
VTTPRERQTHELGMEGDGAKILAGALIDHRMDRQFMDDAAWGITPDSMTAVHAIHAEMIADPKSLGSHVGWKVGTTNETAWSSFKQVEPMRAPIFSSSIVKSPGTFSKKVDNLTMLEAEFAFKLKADLAATWANPVSAADAWDAVEEVYLAIEVCGSRFLPDAFAEASPFQKIADGGMNVALILGPTFSAAAMRSKDLAGTKAELIVNGVSQGSGTGADVLGDPINSIAYLANALGRSGKGLKAGMIISAGAPYTHHGKV